ncbi:MAG: carboxypeptidase regulatory-like domain-containing protein, partial [Chloroflexia bacterium]|nr:carboxypeptidase regulatory-like domain-containing protein [Chloroflexia bacterium]
MSWPASIALFAVPLLLVLATIVSQRSAVPAALAVEIADRFSGAPVGGAEIASGGETVVTDPAGLATIASGDSPLRVEIRADGYEGVVAEVNPAGATRWPVALRPASLTGTLRDEQTNAPIASARVAALGTDGKGPETTSGADGTYRLDGVPADARLVVEASDFGAVEQPLGQQTRLDMALKRSVVTGLVRDATGAPIEGARVSVVDGSATTLTGPDGTYRLLGA